MASAGLSAQQKVQEEEYRFPYHYLDFVRRIEYIEMPMKRYRSFVAELLRPYQGQSVLDAGCGDGRLCYDLSQKNLNVTGIDYSQKALAFAGVFCPEVEFLAGDLADYPFEKVFDAIVLMEVLEHLEPSRIAPVLANLRNCLSPQGKLIVTAPSTRLKISDKHYQHFTSESLRETLSPYFSVESLYGYFHAGWRRRLCFRLVSADYMLGSLRLRTKLIRPYYRLVDHLLDSIGACPPEKATQLIAVCTPVSESALPSPRSSREH